MATITTLDPGILAACALLAAVASNYLTTSPQFVADQRVRAEWAAWGLLALSCRLRLRRRSRSYTGLSVGDLEYAIDKEAPMATPRKRAEWRTWLVAMILVAAQIFFLGTSGRDCQWIFSFIPLFALLIKATFPTRYADQQLLPWHRRLSQHFEGKDLPLFMAGCWFPILSYLELFEQPPTLLDGLSFPAILMVLLAALSIAYGMVQLEAMAKANNAGSEQDSKTSYLEPFASVATKAFILSTLYLAVFSVGLPSLHILTLVFTMLRMLELSTTVLLCFNQSPILASSLLTGSALITLSIAGKSAGSRIFALFALMFWLMHISTLLPSKSRSSKLVPMLVLPLMIYMVIHTLTDMPPDVSRTMTIGPIHPVQRLFDANNASFAQMLEKQSKTLEEAVFEYRRRYGRRPPPGFDRWFEMAQQENFQLIDEFDTIMETIEPFWGVPPSTLRARLDSAREADSMTTIFIQEGKVGMSHHFNPYATTIKEWLEQSDLLDIIPDLQFVISIFDEPRVVAPYDTLEAAMKTAAQSRIPRPALKQFPHEQPDSANTDVRWISIGKQGTFEAMLSSCHLDSPARSGLHRIAGLSSSRNPNPPPPQLPFLTNTTAAMDVCASTNQLNYHGVLSAPDTMILTHSLVPIFSQCKPSLFSDILYPSPYYGMEMTREDPYHNATGDIITDPTVDPPWSLKLDRLYWAGSSTGGFSTETNWHTMHRQRLTLMTSPTSTHPTTLLSRNTTTSHWQPHQSTFSSLAHLFYLRITSLTQCTDAARQLMLDAFGVVNTTTTPSPPPDTNNNNAMTKHLTASEPKSAPFQSKYALDIDGNAYSGRFYRLLKSNSAVLKHTSFREWHDGRLQPWLHYIPVSSGAEELGELMRFLVEEEEGRQIGEEVARRGREWARGTLRDVDLRLVMVRVLMEFGRVVAEGREGLGLRL